jgi:hypothetical protein
LTNLNALRRHWGPFLQSISGRAELPTFDRLWTNCTEEEIRLIARAVQDSPHDDNHALAFHTKKGGRNRRSFSKAFKGKKTSLASSHDHRKDKSKIHCFRCDKYGHIVRDCPTRKKGRQLASTVDVDLEPHQRNEDIKDHRKDKSKIQCFRCDKYGHIARDCPTRKKGRQLVAVLMHTC